ncbi:toll/interleukin-1 receptor domain-containing protein [Deinococcus gobiensis]|nr:toll/interleukin-1 receptor domain-containing protein [Deinococcus gobiensis]
MKVFLSWSGEPSRQVAKALKGWIELVLPGVQPWMSDKDLGAGVRWSQEIEASLKLSSFGVICVTASNRNSPWLNFEAGAISNNLSENGDSKARVVPYLLDVVFNDINGPLSQFHGKQSNKSGTWELVQSLNNLSSQPRDIRHLEKTFEAFWPELEDMLADASALAEKSNNKNINQESGLRDEDDKMNEMLTILRNINNSPPEVGAENLSSKVTPAKIRSLANKLGKDLGQSTDLIEIKAKGREISIITVPMTDERKEELRIRAHQTLSEYTSEKVIIRWAVLFEDGHIESDGVTFA